MLAIRAIIHEWIQEHDIVAVLTYSSFLQLRGILLVVMEKRFDPLRVLCILGYYIQDFYFIVGGFQIVLSALLDFKCDKGIEFQISGEPNRGEMPPS